MSEGYSETYTEKVIDELLKAIEELELRERSLYLPFNQLPDPRVRQTILMLVRKYADMTENFAQSLARRAENYGVMITLASIQQPKNDGVILVLKLQVLGVRGDILKERYKSLKRIVRSVKGYKSIKPTESEGELNESGERSPDRDSDTTTNSQKDTAEGNSQEYNGSGSYLASNSKASGRILEL